MTARKALVTGGNRGIGRAIAEGLVAQGHEVFIGVRSPGKSAEVAAEIGATCVELDLMNFATISSAVAETGGVDVLINNAGVLDEVNILEDASSFHISIDVMFLRPYELIRNTLPYMRQQGWGRIVNVSSGWGAFSEGLEGPGAYGVAKAGLNALTKALPRDLPPGIKVNAMCPGWVATRMGGPGAPRTPKEGADTAIWLAGLPDNGPTGGFFRDRTPIDW
ncbi:MAG: SDR family NAD(P)-dependent oxidoreductase [Pseudomonadota bacterium]